MNKKGEKQLEFGFIKTRPLDRVYNFFGAIMKGIWAWSGTIAIIIIILWLTYMPIGIVSMFMSHDMLARWGTDVIRPSGPWTDKIIAGEWFFCDKTMLEEGALICNLPLFLHRENGIFSGSGEIDLNSWWLTLLQHGKTGKLAPSFWLTPRVDHIAPSGTILLAIMLITIYMAVKSKKMVNKLKSPLITWLHEKGMFIRMLCIYLGGYLLFSFLLFYLYNGTPIVKSFLFWPLIICGYYSDSAWLFYGVGPIGNAFWILFLLSAYGNLPPMNFFSDKDDSGGTNGPGNSTGSTPAQTDEEKEREERLQASLVRGVGRLAATGNA